MKIFTVSQWEPYNTSSGVLKAFANENDAFDYMIEQVVEMCQEDLDANPEMAIDYFRVDNRRYEVDEWSIFIEEIDCVQPNSPDGVHNEMNKSDENE